MSKRRYRDRELDRDEETILQIGKEGKEGDKNFKEYMKNEEKLEKEQREKLLDELTGKKRKFAYNLFLANILKERLEIRNWLVGWQ